MKQRHLGIILLALLAFRLLMTATTPVFEPSEARYATLAANMARTGDFLVPRLTYEGVYRSFDGKPPLVFQAGGVACRLFGVTPFAVRLFPLLSALLLLAILHRTARVVCGRGTARRAVALCATSVAFYATAGFCMTDIPLACCVAGALLLYLRHRETPRLRLQFGIAALLGCGMLVKGPVALALFALPVLADALLNHRMNRLLDPRWFCVLPLFLLVAAPWFVLMQTYNPGFLRYFFVNENLLRFLVHDYGDKYGAGRETFRGMALVWLFVTTLPWSLLPPVVWFHDRRLPRLPVLRSNFPLLAAGAITAFWCLTSRVPLAYLLPAVPLASLALAAHPPARIPLRRLVAPAALLAMAALGGTLLATRLASNKMPGPDAPRRISDKYFSYEFYHGPWGEGAPKTARLKGGRP